jgi:hypothetical protein
MPPISSQDYINAKVDADTLAQIVNGDATQGAISLRLGGTAKSLRNAAATIAKGDPGADGEDGASFVYRGQWSPATQYHILDVLINAGVTYMAVENFTSAGDFDTGGLQQISGTQGTNGTNGIASLPQLAQLRATTTTGLNLVNPSIFVNGYLQSNGTIGTGASGYQTSDYIPANTSGTMNLNKQPFGGAGGNGAFCFYDQNLAFISQVDGTAGGGGFVITVPSTAAYVRFTLAPGIDPATFCLVIGSVQPTPMPAFKLATQTDITAISNAALNTASLFPLLAKLPISANMLNLATVQTDHYLNKSDGSIGFQPGYAVSDYIPMLQSFVTLSRSSTGDSSGCAFYDNSLNVLLLVGTWVAGTPIAVPSGAVYMRVTIQPAVTDMMVCPGSTVPSEFVGFGAASMAQLTATRTELASLETLTTLKGINIWFVGDSITAFDSWQASFLNITKCTQVGQDAIAGRKWSDMFDYYGGDPINGVNATPSGRVPNGGIAGNTLKQDMTALNVGLILIHLGTNSDSPTGTYADVAGTASMAGYIRTGIEAYIRAAPRARLLVIGPRYAQLSTASALTATNTLQAQICADYGVPYLNWYAVSGFSPFMMTLPDGNSNDIGVGAPEHTYSIDGTHPSNWCGNYVYGPMFARWAIANAYLPGSQL